MRVGREGRLWRCNLAREQAVHLLHQLGDLEGLGDDVVLFLLVSILREGAVQ